MRTQLIIPQVLYVSLKISSDYIKGVNIQFVPGEELQVIFQGLKFNLVPTRAAQAAVIKAQKAGKTTVDISGKNGSSDSESPDEI